MPGFWRQIKTHFQEEILGRIKRSKRLGHVLDASNYALPLRSWQSTGNVLLSILFASLLINLLSLAFPLSLLQIYDRIIPNVAMNTLVLLVVGVMTALLLEALLKITRTYVGVWADSKFEHIVGCRAFERLMKASLLAIESEGAGVHVKRLNALGSMRDFYAGQAIVSLVDLPFIFVLLALIFYIAGILVLAPIVMLSIFLCLAVKSSKEMKRILTARQEGDDRRFNYVIETLSNIHTVKAVSMEAQMQRRYERLQRSSSVHDHNVSMELGKAMGTGVTLSQLTLIAVVAFGSLLVIKGQLTIGGLAACTLLSGRCLQPVNTIIGLWSRLQSIKIARADLNKLLHMPLEEKPGLPDMPALKGSLELRKLGFQYPQTRLAVLKDVNLTVHANETIALTGKGLSGRSTLMNIIVGMLQPTAGVILLDGRDTRQFNATSYRKQIAYLPQRANLFNGTIMENLTLFREDEFYDQAIESSVACGLESIVELLPKGYDTVVANQSIEAMPRGTVQRIAIARALIHKPAIIIFDEANTSMDMQGDAIIHDMLKKIMGKCTMIIVSHRPSLLSLGKRKFMLADRTIKEIQ